MTVCFTETLASTDESTRCQNPEEYHHPYCRENLESRNLTFFLPFKLSLSIHFALFMEPEGSVPCSQELATGFYSEMVYSSPHPHILCP
jgi:hypothetical protein